MARMQHLKLMNHAENMKMLAEEQQPLRAAFPEDFTGFSQQQPQQPAVEADAPDPVPESAEYYPQIPYPETAYPDKVADSALYPDAAYPDEPGAPRWDEWPQAAGADEQERRFDPNAHYDGNFDPDLGGEVAALPLPEGLYTSTAKQAESRLWALVALVCAALLILLGREVYSWRQAYVPFRQKVEIVSRDTIAQGVLIDGTHVGGMTRAQARQMLNQSAGNAENSLRMTVRVDGQTWVITPNELPFCRNTASVIDTAYAVGRQGSVETIATGVTPFEYRYQHLYHTAGSPVSLTTQVTYDPSQVRQLVRIIESNINREAVDAQVSTFDFARRAFTFTDDRAGAKLDGEKLYAQIIAALNRRDFTALIEAYSEAITPRVTKAELMNTFTLVSSYSTKTTSNANRNTNIDLACRAVSGTVVMPGETFSFNKTTGQRTEQKGYLMAAAISGGATVDEIGGGVCQVSSTLFNAAAMANMTIVARSPHTWPSTYVEKGRDATVNWPNLDFQFRNDSETPLFIVCFYQDRTCTVELYGATLPGGETIELETVLVATQEPPDEPIYAQNTSLPQGTFQEKKKARTGYTVDTYKVVMRNGREISRDYLCTSNYQMIQQVIEYN